MTEIEMCVLDKGRIWKADGPSIRPFWASDFYDTGAVQTPLYETPEEAAREYCRMRGITPLIAACLEKQHGKERNEGLDGQAGKADRQG